MEFAGSPFEIKQLDESGHIEGLLAGFNNLDSHGDRLASTAFKKTLAARGSRPLPMLVHHDLKRPIGAWKEWQERSDGLYVKGSMTLASRDAQEAYALAKDGALTGLSIGFTAPTRHVNQRTGEADLLDLELVEGSLVTIPSNPKTYVSSVKFFSNPADIRQDEIREVLQAAGMPARMAKAIAATRWKSINDHSDEAGAEAELAEILMASTNRLHASGGQ